MFSFDDNDDDDNVTTISRIIIMNAKNLHQNIKVELVLNYHSQGGQIKNVCYLCKL